MNTLEKTAILADAAKYDASCASSGSDRAGTAARGICHSWTADGRCVSLFKVLLSNDCIFDCAYCLNRRSNSRPRATFTVDEICEITRNFYIRNYVEGLFLSSAVVGSVNRTMAEMVAVCQRLRTRHRFNGYIHLKVIPGASAELVHRAGLLADRLSVNIELPSSRSLKALAPQKSAGAILRPMRQIWDEGSSFARERGRSRHVPRFCPAGQSTQMIIGASAESDLDILALTERLYGRVGLKRVYYSAYMAVNSSPNLPAIDSAPPLVREHRLYQADWLLRFYHFQADEILAQSSPYLDERLDPKAAWALRNFDLFPLDINHAAYEELLRVPGVGVTSARRIIATRRLTVIREEDLARMGLVLKRARHFLAIGGKFLGDRTMSHRQLAAVLRTGEKTSISRLSPKSRQLRLF
ncbi:MAG: putative DNA modification/repair radical SAM protein [Desulfopila sp.]